MLRNLEMHMAKRFAGHNAERHVRFFGGAVALFYIALQAGCHDVVPAVHAATRARHDVVDRQIMPAFAAIHASVIVAVENVSTRQADFFVGNFDVAPQPDDRGQWKIGVDKFAIVFDLLCFAFHQQHDGAPPSADVQWFVGCI